MSGLDTLKARLDFRGGAVAESRFQNDKLESLKRALRYSYQAETAVMPDGSEFRCLINPDKLHLDYDDKIISIPYNDVCLNAAKVGKTRDGLVPTGIKTGVVFQWKETNTYWIVYLQHLEESAYFRAEIRQCNGEIEIDGHTYKVYTRGPTETEIQWNQKNNTEWNDINYSLVAYITKTEETLNFFHRFTKVKITDEVGAVNTWQVAVANPYYGDGIIELCLNEYYNNTMEDAMRQELPQPEINEDEPYISGSYSVQPYDTIDYKIVNADGGEWILSNKKAKIISSTDTTVVIEIVTGKSGNVDLSYIKDNDEIAKLPIVIKSL
jgi:hypothetical protein